MNDFKIYDSFCPVCRAEGELIQTRKKYYVRCSECGDRVKTGYYVKFKEAIRAWKRGLIK